MSRLKPGSDDQIFVRRLVLVVIAFALMILAWRLSDVLLLMFGALLAAILLSAVADWIDSHSPLPRSGGLFIATLLMLAIFVAIGWLFSSETAGQAGHLANTLPTDWGRFEARLAANPLGRRLVESIEQMMRSSTLAKAATLFGLDAGKVLVNFIIIVIGAVFFAADPQLYKRGFALLAPGKYRPILRDLLDAEGMALKLWLLTQLFSMTAMGIMIAIGLWWSGLRVWASLGVLGGLSEFIPYVGPTLAMIPAIVVAAAGEGSLIGVLVTYAIVRIVQVNIITPLISQRVVAVPAAVYLFAIIGMGFAFGVFGMFFAGALTVAGFTLVRQLYLAEVLGERIPQPGEE